jgi:hypothetical protein
MVKAAAARPLMHQATCDDRERNTILTRTRKTLPPIKAPQVFVVNIKEFRAIKLTQAQQSITITIAWLTAAIEISWGRP